MSSKQTFIEAMDRLRASDDLYERVMDEERKSKRHPVRTIGAVVAASIMLAFAAGGSAYAVGHVPIIKPLVETFFPSALGGHGMGDKTVQDNQEIKGTFTREYGTLDAGSVSSDLQSAVQPIGLTLENQGYTLAIHDMVIDENGCGIVRYTLTHPDGIFLESGYGFPNEIGFDEKAHPGGNVEIRDSHGGFLDYRCFYNSETLTDTSLDGTMYFAPIEGSYETAKEHILDGIQWELGRDISELHASACTEPVAPERVVSTRKFSDGKYSTAALSPFSISFVANGKNRNEYVSDKVMINYTDGSSVAIEDDTSENIIDNSYVRTLLGKTQVHIFTKPIDVNRVSSITVEGNQSTSEDIDREKHGIIKMAPVAQDES